jgi:hypothetical protein
MLYLPDADTINYALKGTPSITGAFRHVVAGDATLILCPIVHFQITRYLKLKAANS